MLPIPKKKDFNSINFLIFSELSNGAQFSTRFHKNKKASRFYTRKPFFFNRLLLFDKLKIVAFIAGFYNSEVDAGI